MPSKETEEERAARKERERRERPRETEEERAARKERERRERPRETEEERAARKERERREGRDRPRETEEERAARKERERREGRDRPKETEEERAARKERERREGRDKPRETEEERAARKERERREGRPKETEEERAARKERERKEGRDRPRETEEERAARKERERREGRDRPKETEEERAARKERERREGRDKPRETEEERAARKERERREGKHRETEEERAIRKAKERKEREEADRAKAEERARREVVHKPLPAAVGSQPKQTKDESPKVEKQIVAAPPKQQVQAAADEDGEDDYGYDDDFEEELDPALLAAAQQAVAKENTALKQSASTSSKGPAAQPELHGESRAGLDPNSLQRQKHKQQYEKDIARATALRRLVDLDTLSATLVDLPPMSEYDLFIRNFGGVGRDQHAIQAPPEEDMISVETQAERIHSKSKGGQCPEDLGLFPERAANAKPSADASTENDGDDDSKKKVVARTHVDTTALGSFLNRAYPVIRTLFDENETAKNPLARRSSFSNHSFSSTVVPLHFEPAAGRRVVDIVYSRLASHYMLVVYGPPAAGADPLQELNAYDGVAIFWNINDVREPDKVFVSHSELTCGCLSASRSYLIYAGTTAGSVCIWDAREPDHHHQTGVTAKGAVTFRLPSFSTEWGKDNHTAPIVKCCIAGYNSILGVRKDETEQMVSLDRRGQVFFWRVNDGDSQVGGTNQRDFLDAEYGQNLFSSVRLHRAGTLAVTAEKSDSGPRGTLVTNDIEFVPTDTSHIVVATTTNLRQLSRFGSIAAPSTYRTQSTGSTPAAAAASTVHYSNTDSRVLVAGYRDGNIRMFLKDDNTPQVSMNLGGSPIVRVRCSSSMKWVVFALDEKGSFYVCDYATTNRTTPVAKSDLQEAKSGRCTAFDVSFEEKSETKLGIGYEKGLVEVHTLNSKVFGMPNQRNERWL